MDAFWGGFEKQASVGALKAVIAKAKPMGIAAAKKIKAGLGTAQQEVMKTPKRALAGGAVAGLGAGYLAGRSGNKQQPPVMYY